MKILSLTVLRNSALAFGAVINSAASVDARPVLSPGCAPAGPMVYSNDFEGAVGPEWSSYVR